MENHSFLQLCGFSAELLILFGVSGCGPEVKTTQAVRPVQTLVLSTAADSPVRRFPGEVAAADTSNLSFDVPGRLVEFPASQEGLEVKQGDLLGQLDTTNFVARVDAARADYTNARSQLERRRQALERRAVSRSEFDQAQRAADVADAALREAQRALEDTRLVAPLDGRVARRLVNNFQNVQAHQPVLVFQNNSMLEVDIQIPEADMSKAGRNITPENAAERLEATVEFPAIPGSTFPLTLSSFSTEATQSARTFRVSFILYPPEGQNILPGMTCTVSVRLLSRSGTPSWEEEGGFRIPLRAVATEDGTSAVWKLAPDSMQVKRVAIEMGGVSGDYVNVRSSDLAVGDEIVTAGVRFLSEGMAVERIPSQNP